MLDWKKIYKNYLVKNIGILIAAALVLIIIVFFFIRIYTRHGEAKAIPDFRGLTESQLQHLIKENELCYTVIDSVYIDDQPRGVVIDQTPKAGELVKKNRRIFFTINSWSAEQIVVPNLIDNSLRSAQAYLESLGFRLGKLIYIPSEYKNMVLGQHYNGKPIDPGTQLPRGSVIDLLVGRGLSNETTPVPNLLGMTVREAQKQAQSLYLNIGAIVMEEGIDSSAAFIYRQIPSSGSGQVLNLGASIDVWLTDDTSMHPDSLIIYDSFPEDDLGGDEDFDNEFF